MRRRSIDRLTRGLLSRIDPNPPSSSPEEGRGSGNATGVRVEPDPNRVAAYLEGRLSRAEAARFERQLERHPELAGWLAGAPPVRGADRVREGAPSFETGDRRRRAIAEATVEASSLRVSTSTVAVAAASLALVAGLLVLVRPGPARFRMPEEGWLVAARGGRIHAEDGRALAPGQRIGPGEWFTVERGARADVIRSTGLYALGGWSGWRRVLAARLSHLERHAPERLDRGIPGSPTWAVSPVYAVGELRPEFRLAGARLPPGTRLFVESLKGELFRREVSGHRIAYPSDEPPLVPSTYYRWGLLVGEDVWFRQAFVVAAREVAVSADRDVRALRRRIDSPEARDLLSFFRLREADLIDAAIDCFDGLVEQTRGRRFFRLYHGLLRGPAASRRAREIEQRWLGGPAAGSFDEPGSPGNHQGDRPGAVPHLLGVPCDDRTAEVADAVAGNEVEGDATEARSGQAASERARLEAQIDEPIDRR